MPEQFPVLVTGETCAPPERTSHMGPVTIGFGVLFTVLGLVGYFLPESRSFTALIPSGFGLALLILGFLARQDRLRMHVMHLAAVLGLIALVGAVVMIVVAIKNDIPRPFAFAMFILMATDAAVFVGLCVESFIDARRRRQQEAGS